MKNANYSNMSDKALFSLHGLFSVKYGEVIKKALSGEIHLLDKKIIAQMEADNVNELVFEWLMRNLTELAKIMYLAIKKTDPAEDEKLVISFCRNICKVPNKRSVTQFDADRFFRLIDECDRRYGNKTGDDYIEYLQDYSLNILGIQFPQTNFFNINNLLELLNADFYFYNSYSYPCGSRFILCTRESYMIDDMQIHIIKDEFIRSPHFFLSVAGEVNGNSSLIRLTSCECIFFNKWIRSFQHEIDVPRLQDRQTEVFNINAFSKGVKKQALLRYEVSNAEELLAKKDIFITDMVDPSILYHEIAHHLSFLDMDPVFYALHHNFLEGDSVLHSVIEALADWFPQKGQKMGTFSRITQIALTDIKRAERIMNTYLSDCWYADEDDYLGLMSNVLTGLPMGFIKSDRSFDFERIAAEINNIYSFLLCFFTNTMDLLLAVIRTAQYDLGVKILDYSGIEYEIYSMYQESNNPKSIEELREFPFFWKKVINYLHKFSDEGWEKYQNILNDEAIKLEQMILQYVSGGNAEKYNSLRNFIFVRAKETGIIE